MLPDRPLRVLFWSEKLWPSLGGVQVLGWHLLPELFAREVDLRVVTNRDTGELPENDTVAGAPVLRLPYDQMLRRGDVGGILSIARKLEEFVEDFQPDLLHLFSIGPNLFIRSRVPSLAALSTVITLHGELPGSTTAGRLVARALEEARGISTCSEAVSRALLQARPELREKVRVVLNGVPEPAGPIAELPELPRLLFLGRLAPEKGPAIAVRAFARLAGGFPGARLTMAGDGPERPALERLIDDLGIAGQVELCGWVAPSRTAPLLDAATLLLIPSLHEGLGLAAIEAGQRGRPVVASRTGGIPEVVVDGITGFTVPPDDPAALASAASRLLEDPGLALSMGRAARRHVQERFSLEVCADGYLTLYRQALGSS